MKLSEMNFEELAVVMADLAEPMSEIANDDATMEALKNIASEKEVLTQLGAFIREVIPLLAKTHFKSTCRIIAALTGKSVEEVRTQKGLQTIADAIAVVDNDLLDFFKSSVHTGKKR